MSNAPATKIKTTCTKCGGTGRYDAPTSYPGGCFRCNGRGYFVTDARTIARREARERRDAERAAIAASVSEQVINRLLAAWGDEFAHIDEQYRYMHVTQKAQRIAFQRGLTKSTYVGALLPHLDKILAA